MAEDRGTDVADTSGSYGGYDQGRDQGSGFGMTSTGNAIMDAIIAAMPGGWGLSVLDNLSRVNIGDGVAGRGSSNNPNEGGANGYQDFIDAIVQGQHPNVINPTTPPRVRGVNEGARRPSRGSIRQQQMPVYGGQRRQPVPAVDDNMEQMPRSINNTRSDPRQAINSGNNMLGSLLPSILQAQSGSNALSALPSFISKANDATASRTGGMTDYLSKLMQRGDISGDAKSINAAAGPRLMRGRNTALSSVMSGTAVPQNLFDLEGLGADIGGRQGAQNVDVRSRMPSMRSRRY